MKVTILPENISIYTTLLGKLLPSHSQIPILSNILLEAKKDGLYLRATDLEKGGEIKIPAKVEGEGSITVPGKEFLETINSLPQDKIVLSLEKDVFVVECRETRLTFNTISSQEFPQLFKEKGDEVARFTKEEFLDLFSYLTFSVSREETRPQLTGVYINSKEKGVDFVSTDGYRMSVKKVKVKKYKTEGLIVSVGLIEEVMTLKSDESIILFANKNESQIMVEIGNVVLLGRMIEGQFPDYEKVLPEKSKTMVVFDRDELLRSVRLAAVFAKDSGNILNLEIVDGRMNLSTRAQGVGEGSMMVDCEKEGEDNKISFNIKYLQDLLKALGDKSITLKLNSPTEPALFEVVERDFVHVIMPIQVD